MTILFEKASSSALSVRILLISTTVISAAVMLKISAPAITDFAVCDVPSIWNAVVSWLRPPYLYIVINCIIITIVASSKLQSKLDDVSAPTPDSLVVMSHVKEIQPPATEFSAHVTSYNDVVSISNKTASTTPPPPGVSSYSNSIYERPASNFYGHVTSYDDVVSISNQTASTRPPPEVSSYSNGIFERPASDISGHVTSYNDVVLSNNQTASTRPPPEVFSYSNSIYERADAVIPKTESESNVSAMNASDFSEEKAKKEGGDGDEFVISKSSWTPLRRQDSSSENSVMAEKPPASARFSHRKSLKSTPDGGKAALAVTKPKRQDTLESTWKTITEGRAMPLTRHLRKSDTWETTHGGGRNHQLRQQQQKMTKSETFNDRRSATTNKSPSSGKLKKEPSLGQDELNRRVEAFIKKFNEEMRLQRQESLNQYKEMISRRAH